jgi:hypothetical protein
LGGLGVMNMDLMSINLLWRLGNEDGMWQKNYMENYLQKETLSQASDKLEIYQNFARTNEG